MEKIGDYIKGRTMHGANWVVYARFGATGSGCRPRRQLPATTHRLSRLHPGSVASSSGNTHYRRIAASLIPSRLVTRPTRRLHPDPPEPRPLRNDVRT